jgi:hypothetical protein
MVKISVVEESSGSGDIELTVSFTAIVPLSPSHIFAVAV